MKDGEKNGDDNFAAHEIVGAVMLIAWILGCVFAAAKLVVR